MTPTGVPRNTVATARLSSTSTVATRPTVRKKLTEFVPQVMIPSEKVYEMRNGKKRVRERNFFPGYVLVQANLDHGEAKHVVTGKVAIFFASCQFVR